jgi:hypothetical protein
VTLADSGGSGVERIDFQLTTFAETFEEAYDVMDQVRLALAAASYSVVPLNNRADYEPDTRIYKMEYDFAMWHR